MFISILIDADAVVYKCWGKKFNISILLFLNNSFILNFHFKQQNQHFPLMSSIVGIPLLTIPVLAILYGAIQVIIKHGFSKALKPTRKWGPAKDEDRRVYGQFRLDDVMYDILEGETGETFISTQ